MVDFFLTPTLQNRLDPQLDDSSGLNMARNLHKQYGHSLMTLVKINLRPVYRHEHVGRAWKDLAVAWLRHDKSSPS